jgi:hypothetical protein
MKLNELSKLADMINGKAWGADNGKPRIYMSSRKDMKVYFEFPDFDGEELGGARLQILIDECGQSAKWYASQKALVMQRDEIRAASLAIMMAEDDIQAAKEIMDLDEISDEMVDSLGHMLVNGRYAEAAAAIEAARG